MTIVSDEVATLELILAQTDPHRRRGPHAGMGHS
jgi:hypothetical protein